MPNTPFTPAFIARWTHYWVAGAIRQGERLMAQISEQTAIPWDKMTPAERQAFNEKHGLAWDHLTESLEGYFFVCTTRNALRWAIRARKAIPTLATAVAAFEKATPDVINVRDMLEHEEEYLAGGGKRADEYEVDHNGMLASAHAIVVHGDDYLLGGRVSVPATLDALRKLLPAIEQARMANPTNPARTPQSTDTPAGTPAAPQKS